VRGEEMEPEKESIYGWDANLTEPQGQEGGLAPANFGNEGAGVNHPS
jgi:hypothetical protein